MKKPFLNITRNIRRNRIDAYYLSQFYEGQSKYARIFNFITYRVLVLVGSFLFFLYFTGYEQSLAAFWGGVSVLLIYHIAAKYLLDKRLAQVKQEVNVKIAEEEFWRRIKAMDKEGFIIFMQEVLAKLPAFSRIEIIQHLESEGIDMLGKYQKELIVIQCQALDGDNTVESRSVRELSKAMSRRKYLKGMIISTTDFRDDTKRFCNLIKDKRQIILFGHKDVLQMAIEAGKYPQEDEIKDLILKKIEHQTRIFQDVREKLFMKPRLRPYFFYGTVLFCCGMLFDFGIKYLYFSGASALYLLGIFGLVMNFHSKKRQANWGWQDKLF